MTRTLFCFLMICWLNSTIIAQLPRFDAIEFSQGNQLIDFPFAGGFNQPQFSAVDFNLDQVQDLFVFDRSGNKAICFLGEEQNGTIQYRYAPQYHSQLPELQNWALMADYNCDGKADLFTSAGTDNGFQVYLNQSSSQSLSFVLRTTLLQTTDSLKVYNASSDIPGLADVDDDGDLDILAFDPSGLFVRYYERINDCEELDFVLSDDCWGQFMEGGLSNDIILNTTCKGGGSNATSGVRHAGSSICVLDLDGNGAKDLLLGDLNYDNVVLVENSSNTQLGPMDQVDTSFPSNSLPVDIFIFPAVFAVDVDQDGKQDLIAASNASGTAVNHQNGWYYRNDATGNGQSFSFQEKDFLE
ncbi:MAG: VCBS repeat-containing protein, partial [Bacteroidota bacterium]